MARDPADRYGAELDTLRDRLIEAVRLRRLSALEAGLGVFEQLGEAILRRVAMIDEVMGDRRSEVPWRQTLGASRTPDRLAPLSRALWPVLEQAVLTGDPQLIRRTLNTVNELARTAYSQEDLASFTDVVVLYPSAARRLHSKDPGPARRTVGVPELTEQLLRVVQTIHFRSRTGGAADPFAYQAAALKQAWEMARSLIDDPDSAELERWANAYEEALTLVLHGDGEARDTLGLLREAGATALRGWVLLSWQEAWRPLEEPSAVALYSALSDVGEPEYLWETVVRDAGEQLDEQLGFGWWESLARSSGQAYIMKFGTYREDAAALTLIEKEQARAAIPRAVHLDRIELSQVKTHGDAARRMLAAISRLDRYDALEKGTSDEREALVARLGTVVETMERRQSVQLIEQPLESSSVAAFREAVLSGTRRSPDSFVGLLHRCDTDVTGGHEELPSLFGVHSLAPKDHFVTTDVHADPSTLGETMASGLVRGEDRLALQAIVDACSSDLLGDRAITEVVSRTMRSWGERGDVHVVIFGIVDWWIQLRNSMKQDMGYGFYEPFLVDGVTYSHHYSGDFRGALIADLSRLACYSRVIAPDDEEHVDELAHLSVDAVSPAEAQEMALAKNADLEGQELEMEKRRLLEQVRVRVLVRPLLQLLDPSAGLLVLPSPGGREKA